MAGFEEDRLNQEMLIENQVELQNVLQGVCFLYAAPGDADGFSFVS